MKSEYSKNEEMANAISHGAGVIFGLIALYMMILASGDNFYKLISSIIYGGSIILLFTASTLYHSLSSGSVRKKLKTLDHLSIYILIAGSYTPYMLISLANNSGFTYLKWIWAFALLGVCFKLFLGHKYEKLSLAFYLGMGWFVIVAGKEMLESVSYEGLLYLLFGGLAYTFGAVFYAWNGLRFNHAIWHCFVLAGAMFHFWSIYWYVLQ
ncbi:MAG: hemolysin D [Gammaproteobacteria bacterium]|nr:MAG: hemolysin D [Gammaproteobacteria bacterium]